MKITIYENFKKRINSTKRPTGGKEIDVVLKAPTSIENPTFILEKANSNINYVKWADHYYFIENKTMLSNNLIEVACKQDELAIYKDDILNLTAFVEYSTSKFNSDILDRRISSTSVTSRKSSTNNSLVSFFDAGSYIVSTVATSGTANRYIMTASNINTMMSYINTINNDSLLDVVSKKYGSVLDCILGCTWVPFTPDNDGVSYPVILGDFTIPGLSCHRCSSTMIAHTWTTSVTIPWVNTDIARRPMETMSLYLPAYGTIALETSKYLGQASISLIITVDITGGITFGIKNSGGTVDYFNTSVGAQVPITSYTQDPVGMLLNFASNAYDTSGTILSDTILGSISGVGKISDSFMSKISGKLTTVGHNASSVGGQGGMTVGAMAQLNDVITLTNYCYEFAMAQSGMATLYGRPLMAITSLSSLTGYVKCNGASVNIDGLEGDKNTVNAYLNSGFYIE